MKTKESQEMHVVITPPAFQTARFSIVGNAPFVSNKFSTRIQEQIREKQTKGSTTKKGEKKKAKDFDRLFKDSMHQSDDGWYGIPAPAFRSALISACRTVGFKMTIAKMSIFVEADGFDKEDGTPLVKIKKGKPKKMEKPVRLATGVMDISSRGMWKQWECELSIKYDSDQFTGEDVANLLVRAGIQVGVGAGRPDSKMSHGQGWGTFDVKNGQA